MTFEEFSMSVQYPNREEQYFKYYEYHVALFRLMCQYMSSNSGFEITVQEKKDHVSYFISSKFPEVNFTMLVNRINNNIVPCMINNQILHAQVTMHAHNMIEIEFL